jgi:hypothetical protein
VVRDISVTAWGFIGVVTEGETDWAGGTGVEGETDWAGGTGVRWSGFIGVG